MTSWVSAAAVSTIARDDEEDFAQTRSPLRRDHLIGTLSRRGQSLGLIKLRLRGAQTCALPLFCDRNLESSPMTLKLKGDLDIVKIQAYVYTENEVGSLN